jgi:YD repeat-containing protein
MAQTESADSVLGTAAPESSLTKHMSDRERIGLRGPVRTCTEETIFSDDNKWTTTWEYSPEGNVLSEHRGGSDGSAWVVTHTYDPADRLIRTTSGRPGEPGVETSYSYDEGGRMASVTHSDKSDRTNFDYDEHGRRMETHSFDAKTIDRNKNVAFGGSPWDAAVSGYGVPTGGTVTVVYDEDERPLEAQVRDVEGNIVSRVIRSYDTHGRVSEEKPTWENPAALFQEKLPADAQNQMSPAQQQAMSKALATLLQGRRVAGKLYSYDSQGRLTKVTETNFVFEKTTTLSYNEHGDISQEVEVSADNAALPVGVSYSIDGEGKLIPSQFDAEPPPTFVPERSNVRYGYQYDSFGNWTERIATGRSDSAAPLNVRRRTITYY